MTDRTTFRGPAAGPAASVEAVIGIPTYRRPERLERLLKSLEPSLHAHTAHLLVADNACDDRTRAIVAAFAQRHPRTTYLAVQERGISATRNALIGAFLAMEDPAPWLAMVDDDLVVGEDWLERMLAAGRRFGVEAVGGPYAMVKETGNYIVDRSVFFRRARQPTGLCSPLNAAGNILISRPLLERRPPLRFDLAYGLSGGEDYDFFRRATRAGARFAWCDEAFGSEAVDPDRLTPRAVFYRYYSTGNYMAVIDRRLDGVPAMWRRELVGFVKAVGVIVQGALRLDRARAVQGVFSLLFAVGGLASLVGVRTYRYR